MRVTISGEEFDLLPQKAVYWPRVQSLLLADLHLGKINHFRKSGIPLPPRANDRNIEVLMDMIRHTNPQRIICLGDLFHSHYNPEWEVFGEVVRYFNNISFELVLGNHDVMSIHQYERKGIRLHDQLTMGPFVFTHHPLEEPPREYYNLAGHIHPGVQLRGKGRQAMTLPCFYFGQHQGILPAFGVFTGLARIVPKKEDQIYLIAEQRIFAVTTEEGG